jgi:hypothetical protein
MGGAIFENLVISDVYKTYLHLGDEPALYYWRTVAGAEVEKRLPEMEDALGIVTSLPSNESLRYLLFGQFEPDHMGKYTTSL